MVKKIILVVLICVGILLRIVNLENVPAGLFADEISLAVNAKTIAQSGVDEYGRSFPFAIESFSDFKMPGYVYISALVFKLMGPQLITIRLVSNVASLISIFLIGYLATLLFPQKKYIGLFASMALALNLYHIHFSRIAYETMLATTMLLAYLICFIKATQNNKRPLWIVAGIFSLFISMWSYPAPKFIIPIFTILITVISLRLKPTPPNSRIANMLIGGVFLIFALISFIPTLLNPALDRRPLSYVFDNPSKPIVMQITDKTIATTTSLLRIFNFEYLFDKGDIYAYRHGTKESGVLLAIFAVPLYIGIYRYIKSFNTQLPSRIFIFLLFIVCALPSALTSSTPYGPRLLPITIPLTLVLAEGLYEMIGFIEKRKKATQLFLTTTISIIFFYQLALFTHIYFVHFQRTSLAEFSKASYEMGMYVKDLRKSEPSTSFYFLNDKSCEGWGYENLHLWYFADLPNKEMIQWNNIYREKRYKTGDPFGSYDRIQIPTFSFDHITLYPSYQQAAAAPSHSIFIRCGIHLPNINAKEEVIEKVIYKYDAEKRDPYYVISRKI